MPARLLIALLALVALPASAHAQGSASFAQLAGERGCLQSEGVDEFSGEEVDESCGRVRSAIGPTGVAVAPDQKHVYVTSGLFDGSDAITAFTRDQDTGALTFGSCVSDSGGDGRVGTDGFCADGDALIGATDLAFSPDGRFVYVASSASNGLAWFERDPGTGALTQRGCLKAFPRRDRCAEGAGLEGANGVALSPGGEHVYVTAGGSGAVNVFARDAQTGALTEVMCVSDNGSDGRCLDGTGLEGASSVVAASDGRNVYVTAADVGAVTAYARDAATGRLLQNGCLLDGAPAGGPCRTAPALAGAADATLTPDGRQLLVVSEGDSALSVFSRDAETGALAHSTCFVHEDPQGDDDLDADEDGTDDEADEAATQSCREARALGGVRHVEVSPDGRGVFTANEGDYLSAFQRDRASGRLEQFGCAEEERTYRACAQSRSLFSMEALAVSADARNLYVASSAGVSVFAASVAIASRSARVSRSGAVRVRLDCPRGRRAACAGRVSAVKGGARRYRIAAGRSATLRLRLPARVRRAAARRGRAHVTLHARDRRRLTGPAMRRLLVRPRRAASARAAATIAFRTIERSSGTGSRIAQQRTLVVRSLRRYKQVWRQLHMTPKKRPVVDFSKHMLVLVTQGEQPSSGYGIAIEHVEALDGEMILHVAETQPDPAATHCSYLQVVTRPYHLVRVRKSTRPVAPVQRRTQLATC